MATPKIVQWKNRKALVKRGVRMIYANWRNRAELDDLDRWYERNYFRYAAFNHYPNMPHTEIVTQLNAVRAKFWNDCVRIAEIETRGKAECEAEKAEQRRINRRRA